MKIASSNVMMASTRYFSQSGTRSGEKTGTSFAGTAKQYLSLGTYTYSSSGEDMYSLYGDMTNGRYRFNMKNLIEDDDKASYESLEQKGIDVVLFESARADVTEESKNDGTVIEENLENVETEILTEEADPIVRAQTKLIESYNNIRFSLLSLILQRFDTQNRFGVNYQNGQNFIGNATALSNYTTGSTYSVADNGQIVRTDKVVTYSERESTNFAAKGMATTEDGRVIEFNVDINMSRSFMEYMEVSTPIIERSLVDPLMINIGSDVAKISDQKFIFDLDADGTEDEISMPENGTGFLALDLNEDGKINDGSELFGTKSGNGFADLSKYDQDGNGWIDENDSVYSKLKVWFKDEDGKDVLMNLKEADVGAISLASASTDFTLAGIAGETDGMIRRTGVYLKESGGVGSVQHVDLAVS